MAYQAGRGRKSSCFLLILTSSYYLNQETYQQHTQLQLDLQIGFILVIQIYAIILIPDS